MSNSDSKTKYPAQFIIELIRYFLLITGKLFWRIKFEGTENIPQKLPGGLLVVANHQTYFDPFWICVPIKRKYRFMAWDKACDLFLVGKLIRYLGAFPVSLKRGGNKKAMQESLKCLREGATLIIFPEGSRGFSDGKLLKFKTGAVRIAIEAEVPILPVTIRGANKVWSQDIKYPKIGKVEIYFHPLFEISTNTLNLGEHEFAEMLNAQIKEIIESKL